MNIMGALVEVCLKGTHSVLAMVINLQGSPLGVNCRNRLKPTLPNAYFGNAVLPPVTKTWTFDDLKNKPLSNAVGNIREALGRLTDVYVRLALDYTAEQKDVSLLRNTVYYTAASPEGQFRGNPNLTLVSWMNFSFQDADFGWGKPVYLGPRHINSDGKAYIMNNGNGDGFIVVICLHPIWMLSRSVFMRMYGGYFLLPNCDDCGRTYDAKRY